MLTKECILWNEVALGPDPNPFEIFFKSHLSNHIQIRSFFITKGGVGGVGRGVGEEWNTQSKLALKAVSFIFSLKLVSSDIIDNIHAERRFASK